MHSWLPALLAVLAAFLIAAGTVMRQRESHASGKIARGWWIGAVVAVCGFVAQAVALGLGSILLVQPLVTYAVLFVLPIEAWFDYRRPSRIEWLWGCALVVCVTLFIGIARPKPSTHRPDDVLMVSTIGTMIALLALCIVVAERLNRHYKSLLYGVGAGAMFGVTVVLIHALAYEFTHDPLHVVTKPEIYLAILAAVAGIIAQQRAFGAGELQTSFPALTVMELVVSMALGVLLLGENLRVSVPTAVFLGVVLVGMIRAVLELTRLAARRAEEERHRHDGSAGDPG